jgi:hypothetical protein
LGCILEKTNAEIVLSSSWRFHTVEKTREHMTKKGFRFSNKITGVTIRAHRYIDRYIDRTEKIHLSIPRGVEIKQWIDTNIHYVSKDDWGKKKYGVDYTYAILDDDNDMLLEHKDNFLQTDPMEGLTKEIEDKTIEILNNV